MDKNRNYGIDLLRLTLMFMICILHTLGHGGILESCIKGTINYNIYWFIEIFAYCAVDSFAIISGYMAKDKPQKYEKIVNIWFQAFFYSFIIGMILTIVGINETLTIKDAIKLALPITFNQFWYITGYFVLFFAIPILNKFIFNLDETKAKYTFIIVVILFSILGTIHDPFVTNFGYSALWLIILYLVGGLAKQGKIFESKKSIFLIIIWSLCILTTWGIKVFLDNDRLINYVSPTILLSGFIMVIIFSRINIKGNIVKKISPLALGIYLFHLNSIIWDKITGIVSFVANEKIYIGILHVILFASIIFISGLIIEWIRKNIANIIKLPALSKKIVDIVDKLITKVTLLLK